MKQFLGAVAFFVSASIVSGVAAKDGFFSSTMASWAQAFGTVAALGIAIHVGRLGIQAEERRRRQAQVDQIAMITDAVDMALINFDPIRNAVNRQRSVDLQDAFAVLDETRQKPLGDLANMPLPSWPSAILYSRVLAVADAIRSYRSFMDTVRPVIHAEPRHWGSAKMLDGRLATAELAYRQSVAGVKLS